MTTKALEAANPFKLVEQTSVGIEDYSFCLNNTVTALRRIVDKSVDTDKIRAAAEQFMILVTERLTAEQLKDADTLGEVVALVDAAAAEHVVEEVAITHYIDIGLQPAEKAYNLAILANLLGNMYTPDTLFDFAGQVRLLIAGAMGTAPEATPILGALWFDIMALSTGAAIGYLSTHYHSVPGDDVSYSATVTGGSIATIVLNIKERETMPGKHVEYSRDADKWSVSFTNHKAFCERQRALAQKLKSENPVNAAVMTDEEAQQKLKELQNFVQEFEEQASKDDAARVQAFDKQDTDPEDLLDNFVKTQTQMHGDMQVKSTVEIN